MSLRRFTGVSALIAPALALWITGCATTDCRFVPVADRTTPQIASAAPDAATNAFVRWGGIVLNTRHTAANNELLIAGYPLDRCGRPITTAASNGVFLLITSETVAPGKAITAVGHIVDFSDDNLPKLASHAPYEWPDSGYTSGLTRPRFGIGLGGGSGGVFGGVGVHF